MTQIFLLGSSSVYGVGGAEGCWADLLKSALHTKMYGEGGIGEKYEIYNFGKSGEPIAFVQETFPQQLKHYGRKGTIITIVSVGGNNSKAEDRPDNYVSSLAEYTTEMAELLDLLAEKSTQVIVVGSGFVDEAKTNPKPNPLTGGKSYFMNKRRQEFEESLAALCNERAIPFIDLMHDEEKWKHEYLYTDGLHPGSKGHALICEKVLAEVEKYL